MNSSESDNNCNGKPCIDNCCIKRFEKHGHEVKEIGFLRSYEVDTCLLCYHHRRLDVDANADTCDPVFTKLDDAIKVLKSLCGGFVIKLAPGEYTITRDVLQTVDYLHLVGDCRGVVGVPYIHGARMMKIASEMFAEKNEVMGYGPYDISVDGAKITVDGTVPPDFSCVVEGDIITVLYLDGSTDDFNVVSAASNHITIENPPGWDVIDHGVGFFIHPNVKILISEETRIIPTQVLEITGIEFNTDAVLRIGSLGGYSAYRHNIFCCDIDLLGRLNIQMPNVHLGVTHLASGVGGLAIYQGLLGINARLLVDSTPHLDWMFGIASACLHAVKVQNNSSINLMAHDFFYCTVASSFKASSRAAIHLTVYYKNNRGVRAFYMSTISSEPLEDFVLDNFKPHFMSNQIATEAAWNSYLILTNVEFYEGTAFQNDTVLILDTRPRPRLENNPNGDKGNEGSMALFAENAYLRDETNELFT